jgi:hypothetical protein
LLGRAGKLVDTCDKDFWEPLIRPIGSVRPASKAHTSEFDCPVTVRFNSSIPGHQAHPKGRCPFNTVLDFPVTREKYISVLFKSAGVEFIDENGGGLGLRLRKRAK